MRIARPDDYHGLVPTLDCYRLLASHEVRVYRKAAPAFETIAFAEGRPLHLVNPEVRARRG